MQASIFEFPVQLSSQTFTLPFLELLLSFVSFFDILLILRCSLTLWWIELILSRIIFLRLQQLFSLLRTDFTIIKHLLNLVSLFFLFCFLSIFLCFNHSLSLCNSLFFQCLCLCSLVLIKFLDSFLEGASILVHMNMLHLLVFVSIVVFGLWWWRFLIFCRP